MQKLFKKLIEKYKNYPYEYKVYNNEIIFKILGSAPELDIKFYYGDDYGLILNCLNNHYHFYEGMNDDFESVTNQIDEIIEEIQIGYELSRNGNIIVTGGCNLEKLNFESDEKFFNSFKDAGYLPISLMNGKLEYLLKVRSFKKTYNKDLIITIKKVSPL